MLKKLLLVLVLLLLKNKKRRFHLQMKIYLKKVQKGKIFLGLKVDSLFLTVFKHNRLKK